MKKFIFRSLLFCLAPLPFLYLFAHMVDSGLRKSRHFYYSEWNDIFSGKINADVVINGSSRAWVQVSPRILDSILHVNSYNLGMDGSSIKLQHERLKIYMSHNKKPKYLLQEVSYLTFGKAGGIPGVQQFLPYLSDPQVWHIVTTECNLDFLDRYFPLYKYNNELPLIKEGIRSYMGMGVKGTKYKGYEGQNNVWDSSFYAFTQNNKPGTPFPIDARSVADFRDLLAYCKAYDIKVILFYAPQFIGQLAYMAQPKEKQLLIDSFAKEYNASNYSYLYDSLCYSRSNFYNSMHMNRKAAEIFSTEFANDLKKDIH